MKPSGFGELLKLMKKSPPWIGKKNDEMGHGLVDATIMFSLRNAQINSTYSYFWHLEASPINDWAPSFSYLGNDTGVIINITRPSVETILTVSCEIFDGSTYICTASLPLTIRLNNP